MDLEDLAHRPVFDIDSEQFLGYVVGTVIDADRTRVLGIVTRTRFGRPKMVVPTSSVHLVHDEGIMIEKTGFRWLPLHRKIWQAWRFHRKMGQLKAMCAGKAVGVVVDYSANDEGEITHVIVQRGMIGKTLRIRRDKVLDVEDTTMRLADDALAKLKSKPKAAHPSRGLIDGAAALVGRGLAKVTHRVKTGARSTLVGKPAPWTIKDEKGHVLVDKGDPLTPEALAVEAARGRTGTLTGAVAGGVLGRSVAKRRKRKK